MSPGSSERNETPSAFASSAQIAVRWRSAALLAPYAPHPAYGLTAASLEMLITTAPRPSRAEAASAPNKALVNRNGPIRFTSRACSNSSHCVSASKASGVGSEVRSVVDERIEPAEVPRDLQRQRIDVFLASDVADDAARASLLGDLLDGRGGAGDEGDTSASGGKEPDKGETQAGRPARDGDAKRFEISIDRHSSTSSVPASVGSTS